MTSITNEDEPLRLPASKILKLKQLKLSPWTEYLGEFIGSTTNEKEFHLAISINNKQYRISVPIKSKEREILDVIEVLDDQLFQKRRKRIKLGILVTDNPNQPIRLRRII
jgi:hypothetical protein